MDIKQESTWTEHTIQTRRTDPTTNPPSPRRTAGERGLMLHEESIVTLLSAILGSSALGGIGGWMAQKLKRHRNMVTRDDLKPIEEKLDKDYKRFADIDEHLDALDQSMNEIMLIKLRQCIFANPHDRNTEESILQSGEQYLKLGGNGVGRIRLNQVREDYAKRLEYDDWDYTPGHHPGEGGES